MKEIVAEHLYDYYGPSVSQKMELEMKYKRYNRTVRHKCCRIRFIIIF